MIFKYKNGSIRNVILSLVILTVFVIEPSEEQFRSLILERQTLQSYCSAFKSCNDCKHGAYQCEWCHDVGCTNFPRLHCPKKFFLDNILKKDSLERFCTEVVTRSPIFVPGNVKRIIKLDLKIDDMTLYERNIVCELQIDGRVIQVKGTLDKYTVYCDAVVLKIPRSVALGYLRLIWGGVEPYSNMILMVVYTCQNMALNCVNCQSLSRDFQCGWCKDTSVCNLKEECPRQYGPWIDRNFTCERYDSAAFSQFKSHRGLWH